MIKPEMQRFSTMSLWQNVHILSLNTVSLILGNEHLRQLTYRSRLQKGIRKFEHVVRVLHEVNEVHSFLASVLHCDPLLGTNLKGKVQSTIVRCFCSRTLSWENRQTCYARTRISPQISHFWWIPQNSRCLTFYTRSTSISGKSYTFGSHQQTGSVEGSASTDRNWTMNLRRTQAITDKLTRYSVNKLRCPLTPWELRRVYRTVGTWNET